MLKSIPFTVCIAIVCLVLGTTPNLAFAQHAGHAVAGGVHTSASGYAYGGYHAGYGWHGAYGGWRGGYWGYPYYPWGFSVGLGWAPYWGTYPYYSYGYYSPAGTGPYPYYYPYRPYYRSSSPCRCPCNGPSENSPSTHSRVPVPKVPSDGKSPGIKLAIAEVIAPEADTRTDTGSHNSLAKSKQVMLPPPRREVQNVIRALLAIPPDARRRQINSGRYSDFTTEERELLVRLER